MSNNKGSLETVELPPQKVGQHGVRAINAQKYINAPSVPLPPEASVTPAVYRDSRAVPAPQVRRAARGAPARPSRIIKEVWNVKEAQEQLALAVKPLDAYLFTGFFGTGARLAEFIELTPAEIKTEGLFVSVLLATRKNKRTPARRVWLKRPEEDWLIQPLLSRAAAVGPGQRLLPRCRRWVEKRTQKLWGKHPHFFRHCRATYNYNFWGFNDVQNQHFMGWSDTQMASKYTHLRSGDLIAHMLSKAKEMSEAQERHE